MTEKDIEKLKERNTILEARCDRFRSIIRYFKPDENDVDKFRKDGYLTMNDILYLNHMDESNDQKHVALDLKSPEIAKSFSSKRVWIWKRICEFNDYFERCGEMGEKPDASLLSEYCELAGMWSKEVKKDDGK